MVERVVRTEWLEGWDELLERARQAKDDVERELLARRQERAAQLGFGVPGPDRASSRQRGKKRGARRLEERDDWGERKQTLSHWLQYSKKATAEVAAQLVGVPVRTLRSWRARRDELASDKNRQE